MRVFAACTPFACSRFQLRMLPSNKSQAHSMFAGMPPRNHCYPHRRKNSTASLDRGHRIDGAMIASRFLPAQSTVRGCVIVTVDGRSLTACTHNSVACNQPRNALARQPVGKKDKGWFRKCSMGHVVYDVASQLSRVELLELLPFDRRAKHLSHRLCGSRGLLTRTRATSIQSPMAQPPRGSIRQHIHASKQGNGKDLVNRRISCRATSLTLTRMASAQASSNPATPQQQCFSQWTRPIPTRLGAGPIQLFMFIAPTVHIHCPRHRSHSHQIFMIMRGLHPPRVPNVEGPLPNHASRISRPTAPPGIIQGLNTSGSGAIHCYSSLTSQSTTRDKPRRSRQRSAARYSRISAQNGASACAPPTKQGIRLCQHLPAGTAIGALMSAHVEHAVSCRTATDPSDQDQGLRSTTGTALQKERKPHPPERPCECQGFQRQSSQGVTPQNLQRQGFRVFGLTPQNLQRQGCQGFQARGPPRT